MNCLTGFGYDQASDSDVLLLDISNNSEYKWTNTFEVTESQTQTTPSSTSTKASKPFKSSSNVPMIVSIAVGSFVGFMSIVFGGFFFYKWNRKKVEENRWNWKFS